MKKKRILITGGTGFIGYHLASACLKKNFIVKSLSTKRPSRERKLKKVKYLICDISNKRKLSKILDHNFDYIVNLAGYVDHSNKKKTKKSHYDGCKNLALFFLKSNIKKFVQIGSSIEYGKTHSPQKENNQNKQKTYSVYGNSKLLSTKFLLDLNIRYNFPVSILRLYLVYGPNQDINRVVPITIKNAINNNTFNCSSGLQQRDFIHIEDLVEAILKVLSNKKASGEILNIASGKPIRIKDLILKICKFVGNGKPQFGKIRLRKDEIKYLFPSIAKAKKLLNWRPLIDINEGLKKTIKYYVDYSQKKYE